MIDQLILLNAQIQTLEDKSSILYKELFDVSNKRDDIFAKVIAEEKLFAGSLWRVDTYSSLPSFILKDKSSLKHKDLFPTRRIRFGNPSVELDFSKSWATLHMDVRLQFLSWKDALTFIQDQGMKVDTVVLDKKLARLEEDAQNMRTLINMFGDTKCTQL